jgi:tetratricopeptide (TPR) repeat protein
MRAESETKPDDTDETSPPRRFRWALLAWAVIAVVLVVIALPRGRRTVPHPHASGPATSGETALDVPRLVRLGNNAMRERATDPAAVDRALEQFARGHQLDPGNAGARFGLAWARQVKGLPDTEWRPLYLETIDESSRLAYFSLYNLAYAERKAGRHAEAIVLLEQALRVMPDSAEGWTDLGDSRLALDQWARAAEDLQRATELDAASGRASSLLGRAHAALGQPARVP